MAFINHIVVNVRCESIMNSVSDNLHDIKNYMVENRIDTCSFYSMHSIQANNLLQTFDARQRGILESIDEIHKQFSYLFDANTITFLVSFALALLLTAVFSMNDKVDKQLHKINEISGNIWRKMIQQNVIQRKSIAIYQIYNGVVYLSHNLETNHYKISDNILTLVYMLDREVKSLLKDQHSFCKTIEISDKRKLIELLYDCINYLNIDKLKKQQDNEKKLTSISAFNDNLHSLMDVINDIPEISSDDSIIDSKKTKCN